MEHIGSVGVGRCNRGEMEEEVRIFKRGELKGGVQEGDLHQV